MTAEYASEESTRPQTFQPWTVDVGLRQLWLGLPPFDGLTVAAKDDGVAIYATDDPYEGAFLDRRDVRALVDWLTLSLNEPAGGAELPASVIEAVTVHHLGADGRPLSREEIQARDREQVALLEERTGWRVGPATQGDG